MILEGTRNIMCLVTEIDIHDRQHDISRLAQKTGRKNKIEIEFELLKCHPFLVVKVSICLLI
jgi:hypothetical protein